MPEERPGNERSEGLRRLLHALTSRPTRGQILVAVLLGALGFAAVVQVRSLDEDDEFSGARRGDLVQLLDSLDGAIIRSERQLDDLIATKEKLESNSKQAQVAEDEARKEADNLGILTGTMPAIGPGIEITIDDPSLSVRSTTILNAIEELRDSGAEAIEIGDSRVVAQSYFVDSERGIRVDGHEVSPPYVIEAIGDSHTLEEAITFRGGLIDEVVSLSEGEVSYEVRDEIEIASLSDLEEPEYAQPSS